MDDEEGNELKANFIFSTYMIKIIDKYDKELISEEEYQKFLEILQRWEFQFKMLPLVKKKKLVLILEQME
jgi:hypothetical protein